MEELPEVTGMQINLKEFINFIHTEEWLEIRAIRGKGKEPIPYFFKSPDEVLEKADELKSLNQDGYNIYCGVLPRKKKPEKGGGKEDVIDQANVV